MTFWIGDVNLGPSFQTTEELTELERAGFDKALAYTIVEREGQEMPAGVAEEAQRLLRGVTRGDVVVSAGARWVLEQLAVRNRPQT